VKPNNKLPCIIAVVVGSQNGLNAPDSKLDDNFKLLAGTSTCTTISLPSLVTVENGKSYNEKDRSE